MDKISQKLIIQIAITVVAVIAILIHVFLPKYNIDAITLTLLLTAIAPWLAPLFKSLELPGVGKIEFQDIKNAQEKVQEAGLLEPPSKKTKTPKYSFQEISDVDPNLVLAGMRIELEKKLLKLAEKNSIFENKKGISPLVRKLRNSDIISKREAEALMNITAVLNSAVHGYSVDKTASDWTLKFGSQLLSALEQKINQ